MLPVRPNIRETRGRERFLEIWTYGLRVHGSVLWRTDVQSAAVETGILIDITQHSNLFNDMLIFLKPYADPCFLKSH